MNSETPPADDWVESEVRPAVPSVLSSVWLPTASDKLFNERLRWLQRAVAVPGVLPVPALEAASARAAVQDLNNLAGEALADWIEGDVGQGLRLTARGRRLSVALLVLRRNQERLLSEFGVEFADDVRLLDRVLVRTSARNQFKARVHAVVEGAIQDQVILELPGHRRFGALITRNSADTLGVRRGDEIVALIKASSMMVLDARSEALCLGYNRLRGTLASVCSDSEQVELTVDLGAGLTAVAVIAREAGAEPLVEGQSLRLAFHPSAVIIGIIA